MLQISHLTLTHRKDLHVLIEDFSFVLNRGDKAVLIGEEGNGKSTLLKWIYDPSMVEGYADFSGSRTTQGELLGYLPQELPERDRQKPVYRYFSELPAFERTDPSELHRIAKSLHFTPDLFYSDQTMDSLSGGERVKVQMAGLLLSRPDILLLDEPSNDIDIETLEWMEKMICDFPGSVLFISHDETLIERTANRVILIEQLRRKTRPRVTTADMSFRTFMESRRRSFAKQEQEALSERRDEKKAMERFRRIQQSVEQEQNTVSRQDPHGGRLLKKKMKAVKSMEKRYEREHGQMTEMPETEAAITIRFTRQRQLPAGKIVLDYSLPELYSPSGTVLAKNISLYIRGPEKICITGTNGIGKTTLIREIAKQLLSRKDVHACYMPQDYADLLPMEKTPAEFLAPSGNKNEQTMVRTFLGSMKYTPDEMFRPIRELSGGQKAKLLLLKMSLTEADVLILDEPTRNFSPLSAPEVRQILSGFPGAVISISHDRKYIEEVCEKVYRLNRTGLILIQNG